MGRTHLPAGTRRSMMVRNTGRKAVIYCRVSSAAQTKRGDGLGSQETRCAEYARMRGYEVVHTFTDDRPGAFVDRPGMKALLAFLKKNKSDPHVVLIDDISRLARAVTTHIELRAAIALAGGILESPTVEFGDDADSELQEYILATVAQHQRRKNAEQTLNRMRARVMNGYWPFACPVGYRYEKVNGHGKMLVRDEPLASIVQEALEGYASGRFQIQAEVKRFLESHPEFPRDRSGEVRNQRVTDILTRPVYAGYVEAPDWDIALRKGQHEPLISFETFKKLEERLNGKARVPARKDLNADFPLHGAVVCGDCGTPLTACWSSGRNERYPYYLCPKRGCASYGKSIRREVIEGEFEALLKKLEPSQALYRVARAMFEDLWNHRVATGEGRVRALKAELGRIERQVEQFLDRIADADVPSVITAYEGRIRKLEEERIVATERIARCGRPLRSFDETLRTALVFVTSPWNLWTSERLDDKREVLKLTFADGLAYVRNEGFRTANLSLPFKTLADLSSSKSKMARPAGFEPTTPWFVARYSIQLSYGRTRCYSESDILIEIQTNCLAVYRQSRNPCPCSKPDWGPCPSGPLEPAQTAPMARAQGFRWQFTEHRLVVGGKAGQVPEALAGGNIRHRVLPAGLAQRPAHLIEVHGAQETDRVQVEDILETVRQGAAGDV